MTPSEPTDAYGTSHRPAMRRIAIYVVAVLALCVVLWALIEGGERDLWSTPNAVLTPGMLGFS